MEEIPFPLASGCYFPTAWNSGGRQFDPVQKLLQNPTAIFEGVGILPAVSATALPPPPRSVACHHRSERDPLKLHPDDYPGAEHRFPGSTSGGPERSTAEAPQTSRAAKSGWLRTILLLDALARATQIAQEVGIHAVVVEAIDENAGRFYRRYGFEALKDNRLHLILSMKAVRKLFPFRE